MKTFAYIVACLLLNSLILAGQSSGEETFKTTCAACHRINGGRLIGPDLSGVYERRKEEWLIQFIHSSQKMVKAGDSTAVALYEEYNNIPMPDNPLSDDEIRSILDYIRKTDAGTAIADSTGQPAVDSITVSESIFSSYTAEQWNRGFALFYGKEPFANGTISCFGCHRMNDSYTSIEGGGLGIDLSGSYKKLGQAGIRAVLSNPPFPVMKAALEGKDLTEEEVEALVAMFYYTDQRLMRHYSLKLGTFEFVLFAMLFTLFFVVGLYLLYSNREIPSN